MRSASSSRRPRPTPRAGIPAAWGLLLLGALTACSEPQGPPPPRPHVLLIVADDLGYGDLGIQGSSVRTPHLDALAREGVRFSQGYVSAPVCAPSRAGLLTGRDANRYGYDDPGTYLSEMEGRTDVVLSRREILLSQVLHSAGYASGAFGKWHLGSRPGARPPGRGFDTFFGHLSGAHDYFDWGPGLWGPIFRDGEPVGEEGEYLTHATAREAVAFIEEPRDRPFFAYLAFTAIHPPIQVPDAYVAPYADLPDESQRRLAGMISALDEAVGQVLAALERRGIADDTFVIFLSDNGGTLSSNAPLRAGKATLWEGGIRVPFLMRWPAGFPGGRVYTEPVSALDIVPTVVAAAGLRFAPDRPLDGVDLLPWLRGGRSGPPHPALFWRFRDQWAVREGSLKLVHAPRGEGLPPATGLYDLATDVGETRDLASERPDAAQRLQATLAPWERAIGNDAPAPGSISP